MQTFLGKTAEHLINKHSVEGLKDIVVVLPSQRSALYLKSELAKIAQKTFVAPKIFTIEDFVLQMTGGKLIDPTELLFTAYDIFKAHEPEMSIDKFVNWGNLMLRDFDLLDMYLVDPNQLYAFLSEVKSIERWGKEYGEEDLDQYITPNTKKYFHLYDHLNIVYHQLTNHLNGIGKSYRGKFFKQLVEDLQAGKSLPLIFDHLYFVGFNALSSSEEELFRLCLQAGKTSTLWDTDDFYLENKYHRAGNWLRDYSNPHSKRFLSTEPFLWKNSFFKHEPKEVSVLGFENPSGQIFGALQLIDEWEENYGKEEQIALVLADENVLDQALNYLGKYEDRLNITMGLSLKKTHAFELMEAFWNLIDHQKDGRYSIPLIEKCLENPLVKTYFSYQFFKNQTDFYQPWSEKFNAYDFRISFEQVQDLMDPFPILKSFFSKENPNFLEVLRRLDQLFYLVLTAVKSTAWTHQHDAVMMLKDQIQLLKQILEGREELQVKSGMKLLKQLILQQKLSFEGAEKRSLHVMGLLETRNLDFDRVIILSMNEGVLPGAQKRNSLIPMDIASMSLFNLPTFTQADAVTSYHFHRLLHRPKQIVFSHVLASENSSTKEESRFIKQLRLEWPSYNPNLIWNEYVTIFEGTKHESFGEWTDVGKTPAMLQKIKDKLSGRGLSPSALNTFSSCSMRYYLGQVLGLRKEQQADDEMGADVFGTWIHKFLETLDKEIIDQFQGNYAKVDFTKIIAELEPRLENALNEIELEKGSFDVERGFNVILQEVAKNILKRYLSDLPNWTKGNVQVLALETNLGYHTQVQIGEEILPINLQGRVDKIDLVNEYEVRILDFKTGKVENKDLSIPKDSNLFEALTSYDGKEKLTQLWLYKLFLLHELQKDVSKNDFVAQITGNPLIINPGIISFRNLKDQVLHADLEFESGESVTAFFEKSNEVIAFWVKELLDPNQKFSMTSDLQKCKYCDFTRICRRD